MNNDKSFIHSKDSMIQRASEMTHQEKTIMSAVHNSILAFLDSGFKKQDRMAKCHDLVSLCVSSFDRNGRTDELEFGILLFNILR